MTDELSTRYLITIINNACTESLGEYMGLISIIMQMEEPDTELLKIVINSGANYYDEDIIKIFTSYNLDIIKVIIDDILSNNLFKEWHIMDAIIDEINELHYMLIDSKYDIKDKYNKRLEVLIYIYNIIDTSLFKDYFLITLSNCRSIVIPEWLFSIGLCIDNASIKCFTFSTKETYELYIQNGMNKNMVNIKNTINTVIELGDSDFLEYLLFVYNINLSKLYKEQNNINNKQIINNYKIKLNKTLKQNIKMFNIVADNILKVCPDMKNI
uniref:Uncharacterized protein n=1 Tax=Pithovirus LCPAC102 TaxID=2506587 RepID=A0A481Z2Y7_9VIRU|nr:MAG: hypothetical protein LCPAC102_00620 [Pithovirus LCPAC102]